MIFHFKFFAPESASILNKKGIVISYSEIDCNDHFSIREFRCVMCGLFRSCINCYRTCSIDNRVLRGIVIIAGKTTIVTNTETVRKSEGWPRVRDG